MTTPGAQVPACHTSMVVQVLLSNQLLLSGVAGLEQVPVEERRTTSSETAAKSLTRR